MRRRLLANPGLTYVLLRMITMGLLAQDWVLPPMPEPPPKRPYNSVPMGGWQTFPEIKLDFAIAPGPFEPTWESIEKNYAGAPAWLREAKVGFWVHFGPQAAGRSGDWYARNLYKQGSLAYQNHLKNYGHPSEVGYKEVLRDWNPTKLDPNRLVGLYKAAGARFLLIQGVHHDNFDLWDSKYQPWNAVNLGPKRDLLGEWAKACRQHNMRFGVAFHHEYTWWWWQTAFGSDKEGPKKGIPYDGNLTPADGKGKWWERLDPRLLYGIDLREYVGVDEKAHSDWSPAPPGIFTNHLEYAKWYATRWALRILDVIEKYDPDFIYTDGTVEGPFCGYGTGTGFKADAMQRVMAHFFNRAIQRRGENDRFVIVKFRRNTRATVNTEEFGIPHEINTNQAWIAEAPVGDWYYAPGFVYDPGMVVKYIIEAVSRDGNVAISIPIQPDGSLEPACEQMLSEIGEWMKVNGHAIYGSRAWKVPGEGEMINGRLKMLPGGKLGRPHAQFKFTTQDFRFSVGKDGSLYAFCMTVPGPGATLKIKSLAKNDSGPIHYAVKNVGLLGYPGQIEWKHDQDGLLIVFPTNATSKISAVFKIEFSEKL